MCARIKASCVTAATLVERRVTYVARSCSSGSPGTGPGADPGVHAGRIQRRIQEANQSVCAGADAGANEACLPLFAAFKFAPILCGLTPNRVLPPPTELDPGSTQTRETHHPIKAAADNMEARLHQLGCQFVVTGIVLALNCEARISPPGPTRHHPPLGPPPV